MKFKIIQTDISSEIEEIIRESFKESLTELAFFRQIQKTHRYRSAHVFICQSKERTIGFAFSIDIDVLIEKKRYSGFLIPLVAVQPNYQHQGIGKSLMDKLHRSAQIADKDFCLLHGHSRFYSRFDYHGYQFGNCISRINPLDLSCSNITLQTRDLYRRDEEQLFSLWITTFANENLALIPLQDLSEWQSFHPDTISQVYEHDGKIQGYIRFQKSRPQNIFELLFSNSKVLSEILGHHCKKENIKTKLNIPLSPQTLINLKPHWNIEPNVYSMDGGMIRINPEKTNFLSQYVIEVESDLKEPGNWIFPPVFDLMNL